MRIMRTHYSTPYHISARKLVMSGSKSSPCVHYEVIQALEGQGTINIFVICMDKPGVEHNVIDRQFATDLAKAVFLAREKAKEGEVDIVVLCSAKIRSFLAGAGIQTQMEFIGMAGMQRAYGDIINLQSVFCGVESLPVPTVAMLNGITLGAGLELALSCDYIIADSAFCSQIGFPEVKLGVLPGAGGCARLPRLIGFRLSLKILITGQSIDGKKALKLGIVNELFNQTQTLVKSPSRKGEVALYEYEWLSSILSCIDDGKIGKKKLEIKKRDGVTAVSALVSESQLLNSITEETLIESFSENWNENEKKAELKYPRDEFGTFRSLFEVVLNGIYYMLAVFQVWKMVGFNMIAPYACLRTTFRCYYSGSWFEAMLLNGMGMASLIVSAESKGLMFVFVIARKLKKLALNFGLKSDEQVVPFSKQNCSIIIFVTNDLLYLSSAFIQGLLYHDIPTHVVIVESSLKKSTVSKEIKDLFDYSLLRHHLSVQEVKEKMNLMTLHMYNAAEFGGHVRKMKTSSAIVFSAGTTECSMRSIMKHFTKVVSVSLAPSAAEFSIPFPIMMNAGDPLRNNTPAVEITPLTQQTPPEYLRLVAALISSSGKTPVLTPPTPLTTCGLHVLLSHWTLAVSLTSVYRGNISPVKVDNILKDAGYSKGPFQTMNEYGKIYFRQLPGSTRIGGLLLKRVKEYCETGIISVSGKKLYLLLSNEQIANIFTINIVLTSLYASKQATGLSEAALDYLCISGLVGFPPTEAGPLNFITRLSKENMKSIFELSQTVMPHLSDISGTNIIKSSQLEQYVSDLFVQDTTSEDGGRPGKDLLEIFQAQRAELILLNQKELKVVGECRGVQNREIFVFPTLIIFFLILAFWFFIFILYFFFFS